MVVEREAREVPFTRTAVYSSPPGSFFLRRFAREVMRPPTISNESTGEGAAPDQRNHTQKSIPNWLAFRSIA